MSIDNQFLIKRVLQRDQFTACFCTNTRMPFLYCDPVSFADQAWIFADEDGVKEFIERFAGKKLALQGVVIKKGQFTGFFGSLLKIGVTEVVFTENGASVSIPIEQFVQHKDMTNIPEAFRPLENPQLQLTGLYLMQEVHRKVPMEEKEDYAELNEEFLVNLARSRFMVPVALKKGPGSVVEKLQKKEYGFLNVTMKNGDVYRPIFGDSMEFQKFRQNKAEIQAFAIPFASLKPALPKEMKGYILNPSGCQIILQNQLIDLVLQNFPEDVKKGSDEAARLQQSLAGPQVQKKAPSAPSNGKVTRMPKKEDKENSGKKEDKDKK